MILYIWLWAYDTKQHKLTGKDGIPDAKLVTSGIMMIKPAGGLFIWLTVNSLLCCIKLLPCCIGMIISSVFGKAFQMLLGERIVTALQLFAVVYAFWWFKCSIFNRHAGVEWAWMLDPDDGPKSLYWPMQCFMMLDLALGLHLIVSGVKKCFK